MQSYCDAIREKSGNRREWIIPSRVVGWHLINGVREWIRKEGKFWTSVDNIVQIYTLTFKFIHPNQPQHNMLIKWTYEFWYSVQTINIWDDVRFANIVMAT